MKDTIVEYVLRQHFFTVRSHVTPINFAHYKYADKLKQKLYELHESEVFLFFFFLKAYLRFLKTFTRKYFDFA